MLIFSELFSREHLDRCLSSAFNLRLQNGKLEVIDECEYVLTLDFTLKVCISAANEATTVYQVVVVWTVVYLHYSFAIHLNATCKHNWLFSCMLNLFLLDAWDSWAIGVWYTCYHWRRDRRGEDSFGQDVVSVVQPFITRWFAASPRPCCRSAETELPLWVTKVQGVPLCVYQLE